MTISYDPDVLGIDIAAVLERLRATPGTPYFDRSLASLGGMLLAERLQRELAVENRSLKEA